MQTRRRSSHNFGGIIPDKVIDRIHLVQIFILRRLPHIFLGLMKRLNCILLYSAIWLQLLLLKQFFDFLLCLPHLSLICSHWWWRPFRVTHRRTLCLGAQLIQRIFHDGVISTSLGDNRILWAEVVHEGCIFHLVVLYKSSLWLWQIVKGGWRLLALTSQGWTVVPI